MLLFQKRGGTASHWGRGISWLVASLAVGCSARDSGEQGPAEPAERTERIGETGTLDVQNPTLFQTVGAWYSLSASSTTSPIKCNPADTVWSGKTFAYVPVRKGPNPEQLSDCYETDAAPQGPGAWARSGGTPAAQFANDSGTGQSELNMQSPSIAYFGGTAGWVLLYSAISKTNATNRVVGQRCIGLASNTSGSISSWFASSSMQSAPLYCASGNAAAADPEFFMDGATPYVLWREDIGVPGCGAKIVIQQFVPATLKLKANTKRVLVDTSSITPSIAFAANSTAACPSGGHFIDSPSMVRNNNNELWLFFGGNLRKSNEYATGWAKCGSAVSTATCNFVSPLWGSTQRTIGGKPYLPFQDLLGFGGLSGVVLSNTQPGLVPLAFATAHQYNASTNSTKQMVFRLDISGAVPALRETQKMTWHGPAPIFPFGLVPAFSLSGASLAGRPWNVIPPAAGATPGWPAGHSGSFNAQSADGTFFVGGDNLIANALLPRSNDMVVGAYDPKAGQWTNIQIKTVPLPLYTGPDPVGPATSITPREGGDPAYAGAAVVDVQGVSGLTQDAIAFTATWGFPANYEVDSTMENLPPSVGIWPALGVLTKGADGKWGVASGVDNNGVRWANQWTGGQLSRTNNTAATNHVSEQACPWDRSYAGDYAHESNGYHESTCRGLNELAQFPLSRHLVIAQGLGFTWRNFADGSSHGSWVQDPPSVARFFGINARVRNGGIVVVELTPGPAAGQITPKIKAHYLFPSIPDWTLSEHGERALDAYGRQINLGVQVKEVQVDPTAAFDTAASGNLLNPSPPGTPTSERFSVAFDLTRSAGSPDTNPLINVIQEFTYNAAAGTIEPVSAPIFPGGRDWPNYACDPRKDNVQASCGGYGTASYDKDGNLWAIGHLSTGDRVGMYTRADRDAWRAPLPDDPRRDCAYFKVDDPATPGVVEETDLTNYTFTDAPGDIFWGHKCPPHYDFPDLIHYGRAGLQLSPDTRSRTMVLTPTGGLDWAVPVQWNSTGTPPTHNGLSFRLNDVLSTNSDNVVKPFGLFDTRPGVFDAMGTLWWGAGVRTFDEEQANDTVPNYVGSADLGSERAGVKPWVVLPSAPGTWTFIQAETFGSNSFVPTAGVDQDTGAACPDLNSSTCTILVKNPNASQLCRWYEPDGCSGSEMLGAKFASATHPVTYKVWATSAATTYSVMFVVRGTDPQQPVQGGEIEMRANGISVTTPLPSLSHSPYAWVGAAPVTLSRGENTIQIKSSEGMHDWYLDSFALSH